MPKRLCSRSPVFHGALLFCSRARLRREGPLTLTAAELQANLDRIFAYCSENAEGCRRETSTWVKGVAQTHKDWPAPLVEGAGRMRAHAACSAAASPQMF